MEHFSQENIVEEPNTEIQSRILRWDEVFFNTSSFSSIDSSIVYQKDALVKVREDNKIELIVKKEGSGFSPQASEFLSKYNVEIQEEIPHINASIVYIPLDTNEQTIYNFFLDAQSTPGISYVEPNFHVELDYVPNDDYYASHQWDLSLIGMESAWDHELGSHDVIVAVVDTGIDYTHPDLSENYLPLGYDWVNYDDDPWDDHYHGTHCAGTIAALTNNEIGVAGIANVSIFAEKAFSSSGYGSYVNARLALMHAVDMGADIISCSWGGSSSSQTLLEGIDYAINNGVMVVAAAGNSGSSAPHYPASYPGVIATSATDQNDLKAGFSNYGDWIDVAAPGVSILSTVPYDVKGYYYGSASGTSMAAPHVSGLAALLMSAYPTKSASEIETSIYDFALDLGDSGFDPYYGHGRIDAINIFGPAPPDTTPPSYSNLVESADPLELGDTEIISIDVFDSSGVNQVINQFEGANQSMMIVGGNTWRYESWTPSNVGTYPYKIYMEDNNDNWNVVSDSIQVIEPIPDTTPPTYSNLVESADPLELGDTEIISIDVFDDSGINQVIIQFEGANQSMINVGSNTWRYGSWIPLSAGTYPYKIYMEDNKDNWNAVSDSIQVTEPIPDTTPPTFIFNPPARRLKVGKSIMMSIKAFDESGIKQVLLEYEGVNHAMTLHGDNMWKYKMRPTKVGICEYTIYIEDNNGNWVLVSDFIVVTDNSIASTLEVIDLPGGNISEIKFDEEDCYDPSGIKSLGLFLQTYQKTIDPLQDRYQNHKYSEQQN
jgi:thermitase